MEKTMSRHSKTSNMSSILVLTVVFGFVASGTPTAVMAAPSKKDCTQQDPFERLACRQEALADQLTYTSDHIFAEGTKLHQRIKPARLAHIKNAKEKAQRAKRKGNKESFKRQAKAEIQGNKKGGHLVPLDDVADDTNYDGICDYEQDNMNANCAAIELDESGNLQACNPKKKNKGKGRSGGNPKFEGLECDLFFDTDEASTIAEEEDMNDAAQQLEATYSTTEDEMIEMNDHLDAVNNIPERPTKVLTGESACELPVIDPVLTEAAFALREVHAGLFGGARIATAWFGQDVIAFGFGGNARGLAAVFDGLALAANIAYIIVDELHKQESGELQGAIMNCVNQSAGEVAALQTQLLNLQALIQKEHDVIQDNDNTNTATIMTNLENVRAELIDVLNTPQGLRDAFPISQAE